jgi:hypothetical protein
MQLLTTPIAKPLPYSAFTRMDEDERLITRFVARNPHLSFESLIQGTPFWLCRDTWREIALAWARHDLEKGRT